jgi:hypothetical protein
MMYCITTVFYCYYMMYEFMTLAISKYTVYSWLSVCYVFKYFVICSVVFDYFHIHGFCNRDRTHGM